MPGPFDSAAKRLLREKPQHFVRSFAMLEDILEESWTYQEMIKKGMEKGLEKGREEEARQVVMEVGTASE